MPFYRRLSERVRQARGTRLAFPLGGEERAFRAYLAQNGLDAGAAAPLSLANGIRATPSILLVSSGTVRRSWVGVLSSEQEEALLALVR